MSDLRKAAEQALEFLTALDQDDNDRDFLHESQCYDIDRAMGSLRAALAEPEQSEPVAYGFPDTQLGRNRMMMVRLDKGQDGCTVPLYTASQPRREPLTTEKYTELAHRIASKYAHRSDPKHIAYTFLPHTLEQFVRSLEAAHGITGGKE